MNLYQIYNTCLLHSTLEQLQNRRDFIRYEERDNHIVVFLNEEDSYDYYSYLPDPDEISGVRCSEDIWYKDVEIAKNKTIDWYSSLINDLQKNIERVKQITL